MKQSTSVRQEMSWPTEAPGGVRAPQSVQRRADESLRQVAQRKQLEQLQGESAPPRANGLPPQLRAGIEALSGMDMGGVMLHRNSSKPAQLNAHAYAQGNEIHLGPGQERHLPHEAWHVVQQKQGRVQPTAQLAGNAINDNTGLEREADVMGARALQVPHALQRRTNGSHAIGRETQLKGAGDGLDGVVQRHVPGDGTPFKPTANTGSYNARGGQGTHFDSAIHTRKRFGFGTNTRYEVFSRYNPTMQGNRIVSIRAANGEQVNVEGVQLDHQVSWDVISQEMDKKNQDGSGYFYSFWDAKMYYNDIDNLVPALGALNAAAGASGVSVEARQNRTIEAALGAVQHSWMNLQHVMTALNNGLGNTQVSDEEMTDILLNINESFSGLTERLLGN